MAVAAAPMAQCRHQSIHQKMVGEDGFSDHKRGAFSRLAATIEHVADRSLQQQLAAAGLAALRAYTQGNGRDPMQRWSCGARPAAGPTGPVRAAQPKQVPVPPKAQTVRHLDRLRRSRTQRTGYRLKRPG